MAEVLVAILRRSLTPAELSELISAVQKHPGAEESYFRQLMLLERTWTMRGITIVGEALKPRLEATKQLAALVATPQSGLDDVEDDEEASPGDPPAAATSPDEAAVHNLIEANLWLFEPDYCCDSQRKTSDQAMRRVASQVFGNRTNLREAHQWTKKNSRLGGQMEARHRCAGKYVGQSKSPARWMHVISNRNNSCFGVQGSWH